MENKNKLTFITFKDSQQVGKVNGIFFIRSTTGGDVAEVIFPANSRHPSPPSETLPIELIPSEKGAEITRDLIGGFTQIIIRR